MVIEVKLLIASSYGEYGDADHFILGITEELYNKIMRHREYLKETGAWKITDYSNASIVDENGDESEFICRGVNLLVTSYGIFLSAHNKYDYTTYIESESLNDNTLEDVIKKLKFKKKLKNFIDEPKET